MYLTLSADGWMGLAPPGEEALLRSLSFCRFENGLIRENWVLVELLDVYSQVGVDVIGRMREFNEAESASQIRVPTGFWVYCIGRPTMMLETATH